ncbi:hypothetical protein HGRIS_013333 [Hohenbuehelia grisea]|uniref:Transmembrane protein n=1 Tax=Hohenbuehelia grisea TaxID=104357 RepID=A0ABR3IV74_9AGAR
MTVSRTGFDEDKLDWSGHRSNKVGLVRMRMSPSKSNPAFALFVQLRNTLFTHISSTMSISTSKLSPMLLFGLTMLVFVLLTIIGITTLNILSNRRGTPRARSTSPRMTRDIESITTTPVSKARTYTLGGFLHPGTRQPGRLPAGGDMSSSWSLEAAAVDSESKAAVVQVLVTPPTPAKHY